LNEEGVTRARPRRVRARSRTWAAGRVRNDPKAQGRTVPPLFEEERPQDRTAPQPRHLHQPREGDAARAPGPILQAALKSLEAYAGAPDHGVGVTFRGRRRCVWRRGRVSGLHDLPPEDSMSQRKTETATLAGGCFWCLEAVFEQLEGVERVVSGYAGGSVAHPSYEQVCSGSTGHAEVVQITFDPDVLSFRELLEFFFAFHDPTTLNRQGHDAG